MEESAYGNIIAKMQLLEKDGKHSVPLDDDTVVSLIKKAVKELEESLSYYKEPCDRSVELERQLDVLKKWLPEDLSEEAVVEIIQRLAAIESNKGKLTGMVCKEVGNRYDRSKIRPLIDKII